MIAKKEEGPFRMNLSLRVILILVLGFWSAHPLLSLGKNKIYTTREINTKAPIIDGRPDDPVWERVEWGTDFTQKIPYEGKKPSQETAFKILFDKKNLYVAIRAFDTEPGKIVRRICRRDNRDGDWVEIILDSYYDRRTGFSFSVNAAGVKTDILWADDGQVDDFNWDPVWYAKTARDNRGWTAEMKIPLSQLRFDSKGDNIWGLHVVRFLYREQEKSEWQMIPRNAYGFISLFGELKGLQDINPRRQVELLPYAVAKHERFEAEAGNPFATGKLSNVTGGLDGKIGVTNYLTLDFTINPDFGQVEADPSEVNLTAFETFFDEKRPFFVEGSNIFLFDISSGESDFGWDAPFYSRRIGRTPQHRPLITSGEYAGMPETTSILGAFKLSGKTRSGFSIGILDSITAKESATIDFLGLRREEAVEPLTNYFVGRIQKDFNKGNTTVGG
ncbi:MAG: carbohydrate binding family 9 domain-containing protein, partial [bacterium]|nr:carbohydrate binding family 9 domain-containing protein [bacterium]